MNKGYIFARLNILKFKKINANKNAYVEINEVDVKEENHTNDFLENAYFAVQQKMAATFATC